MPTRPRGRADDALHDLELLIRSRYGLIYLDANDEERAGALLQHLAERMGVPLFRWSRIQGLERLGGDGGIYGTRQLSKALGHVAAAQAPAVYHFHGIGADLADPIVLEHLRQAIGTLESNNGAIVVTGGELDAPGSLRQRLAHIALPGADTDDFARLLAHIIRDLSQRQPVEIDLTAEERAMLLRHLEGLTLLEAEKILTKAIVEDGRLGLEDIRHVVDAKRAVIERDGLLEYYPAEETVVGVADLAKLRQWLAKRKAVVLEPLRAEEFGLPFPRGVLFLGVPGCGKSLSAKAVAMEWGLPLLKLDTSTLYNKYIGETERNFRRAMRAAEQMAPVVLWIDEIEKAFAAGGDADGGVAQRVLGTFLSWMQERRGDVFIVATANNIDRLPAELLRKGRFDEIFFLDLPDAATRAEIFRVHLEGRGHEPASFDLEPLVRLTDGYSGAEIEGVVVAGLYGAFSAGEPLSQRLLELEARSTRPLAVTMAERVAQLRLWARERAVAAN